MENIKRWMRAIMAERFGGHILLLDLIEGKWSISVAGAEERVLIKADFNTFTSKHSHLPFCNWDATSEGLNGVINSSIPMPGATRADFDKLVSYDGMNYVINYDVLGLVFWMLSRSEELKRKDLDIHDRFPATSSHAFKHGYLERPIVDEWLDVLRQVFMRLWPGINFRKNYFSIKLSHDVDRPSRYGFHGLYGTVRKMGGDIFKRLAFRNAILAPWISMTTRLELHPFDPVNTFEWIMDMSEAYGLISAFYFICGRTEPEMDAVYEIEHPAIRNLMRRIHSRGHEIGLHPSYKAFNDPWTIVEEAERLREVCKEERIVQKEWGGRMHYLRWEHPTSLRGWEKSGFNYDTTLGYADRPGFRCGTCFEYPAFDPVAGKMMNLRIRPLVAMECTIMAERYLGLSRDDALDKFCQLKNACRKVNGQFTLLWHNTRLTTQQERDLYTSVLAA